MTDDRMTSSERSSLLVLLRQRERERERERERVAKANFEARLARAREVLAQLEAVP